MSKNTGDQLIDTMEKWFSSLPAMPKGLRDFIITIAPWFALIFGVLGVIGALSSFGFLTAYAPAMFAVGRVGYGGLWYVYPILALVASGLLLAAFPGLKANKMAGWKWLFWSEVASAVTNVIMFNVVGLVFVLIGFYILFQIRSNYK